MLSWANYCYIWNNHATFSRMEFQYQDNLKAEQFGIKLRITNSTQNFFNMYITSFTL